MKNQTSKRFSFNVNRSIESIDFDLELLIEFDVVFIFEWTNNFSDNLTHTWGGGEESMIV